MFLCNGCGMKFETPNCVDGYYECPSCFSDDIDEYAPCKKCGKPNTEFLWSWACEDCRHELVHKYETMLDNTFTMEEQILLWDMMEQDDWF